MAIYFWIGLLLTGMGWSGMVEGAPHLGSRNDRIFRMIALLIAIFGVEYTRLGLMESFK